MEDNLNKKEQSTSPPPPPFSSVVTWLHQGGYYDAAGYPVQDDVKDQRFSTHPHPSQISNDHRLSGDEPAPLSPHEDTVDLSTNSCLLDEAITEDVPSSAER